MGHGSHRTVSARRRRRPDTRERRRLCWRQVSRVAWFSSFSRQTWVLEAAQRASLYCLSVGTVATHQHPIQAAMLAVIVVESGFMQRGAVIDDQQIALFILVRIAKLWLRDLVGQVLQEILGFFG